MKMRSVALAVTICAVLIAGVPPTPSNAAEGDEPIERIAATELSSVEMSELPEYPALEVITSPDAGPQEVEFTVPAGVYRGPDGEVISVSRAISHVCELQSDTPHWSTPGQTVLFKPRVRCKGQVGVIPIRVNGLLGRTSVNSISTLRIVAESDYTQNVQVTSNTVYGPRTTWYVPRLESSTKISRSAYFRGSSSAIPAPPLIAFNIPAHASQFLWVP